MMVDIPIPVKHVMAFSVPHDGKYSVWHPLGFDIHVTVWESCGIGYRMVKQVEIGQPSSGQLLLEFPSTMVGKSCRVVISG